MQKKTTQTMKIHHTCPTCCAHTTLKKAAPFLTGCPPILRSPRQHLCLSKRCTASMAAAAMGHNMVPNQITLEIVHLRREDCLISGIPGPRQQRRQPRAYERPDQPRRLYDHTMAPAVSSKVMLHHMLSTHLPRDLFQVNEPAASRATRRRMPPVWVREIVFVPGYKAEAVEGARLLLQDRPLTQDLRIVTIQAVVHRPMYRPLSPGLVVRTILTTILARRIHTPRRPDSAPVVFRLDPAAQDSRATRDCASSACRG